MTTGLAEGELNYMAGNDLYNAEFMDHVSHPDYKYEMEHPTYTHEGINPSCGDELTFSVRLADDGTIAEAAFTGHGCAISQASADIMSDLMVGRTPAEAIELCQLFGRMIRGEETDDTVLEKLEDANLLHDIAHMPARVKCAELAWRTLEEMLEAQQQGNGASEAGSRLGSVGAGSQADGGAAVAPQSTSAKAAPEGGK